MTLKRWAENSWLRAHRTSPQEIGNLFQVVDRDLHDSQQPGLSMDWKFGIAYNAALKLCTLLLYAEGYRAEKNLQHYRTIQALTLILGHSKKADVEYLDTCRTKRNIAEYDRSGGISVAEAEELIEFVVAFKAEVVCWLQNHYPELLPSD